MTLDAVKAVVGLWFNECLGCPPLAHNTPIYNQAHAAKDELIVRLAALFPTQHQPEPEPAPAAPEAAEE